MTENNEIRIRIRNCIPQTEPNAALVCGNGDFTAVFDFDEAWDSFAVRIARFVWYDSQSRKMLFAETLFEGNSVRIPAVYHTDLLLVGVYAGDALTSAPAAIPCLGCITDNEPVHDPPDPDVYEQLLEYLSRLDPSGGGGAPVDAVPVADGSMRFTIGNAEIDSETVDLLTEPYASHLYNKWFDDYTGQVDDTARPNRVLCDLFIDIPDDRSSYTVQAAVSGSAGQFICYFYDANENFLSSQTVTSWVDSSTLNTIPNAKKLRVLMRLSSNADIAIGNISTFKVLFI
ncbi:MAG: hypothetical protein IKQ91_06775 [Oscillospiraceae bacterium]|nr:hypothetical protein [Oscillospiraceae bacterium]